jgi:hypothetical protein
MKGKWSKNKKKNIQVIPDVPDYNYYLLAGFEHNDNELFPLFRHP